MQKYLIITGGSRGIGKAAVELFTHQGWSVVNLSRRSCNTENVINFSLDFSNLAWSSQVSEQLQAIIATKAQICLVHNAAMSVHDNIAELDPLLLNQMLTANIISPGILNKLFIPKMQAGSSIIYIGSTLSEKAVANYASYVICKHALVGMMRATCQDLAGRDIHTCCICPGFTDTEMLRENFRHDAVLLAQLQTRMASKRLIAPQEIADFIYYCANNTVINGSVLHAHLGQIEY